MDIKTLLIVLVAINLFLGLITLLAKQKFKFAKGINYWIASNFLVMISYSAVAFRGIAPDFISIVLSNVTALCAYIFRFYGFKKLFNHSVNQKYHFVFIGIVALYLSLICYFTYFEKDIFARLLLFSAFMGLLFLYIGIVILQNKIRNTQPLSIVTASVFFLAFLMFFYRFIGWFLFPSVRDIFSGSLYNSLTFFAAIFIDLLSSTLFILINYSRLNAKKLESEKRFENSFEFASIGMALVSVEGKWLKVNQSVCEMFGYTEHELYQKTFQDITFPHDLEAELNYIQEMLAKKRQTYQMEKRYIHKDGSIVYGLLGVSMVADEKGNPFYFIFQIVDINERKKAEEELLYNQNLLKALYDLSPIGIALNEYETGKFIDLNDKLLEPTGYSKEEFLALSYWETTPKEYEPFEATAIQQMESKGSYDLFEKEYIRKDGTRYPIALQGVLTKDANGKKLIWSFVRDISQEKESERKLQEAISSLKSILDASKQVSIIATDKEGVITLFNSGAQQRLGYNAQEVVGRHSLGLIHMMEEVERERIELSEKYSKEIKGFETFVYEAKIGVPNTKEWTYIRKDGTSFPILLSINAIKDHDEIVGYLGVATDISELKKVEGEIKSLLDIANEQNERLRNFAHIVSHNLRSHSAGISGILNLIQIEHPDIMKSEIFEHLNKAAENLNQTVNDLTEIVKVNLTQSDVSKVNIHKVIQKNIESLNVQIKKAQFEIINNIDEDLIVKGIPAYFDSIVLNMITNAIKYRSDERPGYLKIYANIEECMVTINFEDNGQGLDMKKYGEKLFGMYKTFHDHSDSRGVGLFITKNQIESMEGKIAVESEVNVGTTFKISLPK